MKRLFCITLISTIILAGCRNDINSEPTKTATNSPSQATRSQNPLPKPAYDFERQLKSCVLAVCELLPTEKMKTSDYNPALIENMGLSQQDTLADARKKLNSFYTGMVSTGLGGTTNPELNVIHAQLSPGNNKNLDEYDIFIRTEGASNGAKVHDWGARIRCAPVTAASPWQTSQCD